jgi:hypothetical protein
MSSSIDVVFDFRAFFLEIFSHKPVHFENVRHVFECLLTLLRLGNDMHDKL